MQATLWLWASISFQSYYDSLVFHQKEITSERLKLAADNDGAGKKFIICPLGSSKETESVRAESIDFGNGNFQTVNDDSDKAKEIFKKSKILFEDFQEIAEPKNPSQWFRNLFWCEKNVYEVRRLHVVVMSKNELVANEARSKAKEFLEQEGDVDAVHIVSDFADKRKFKGTRRCLGWGSWVSIGLFAAAGTYGLYRKYFRGN